MKTIEDARKIIQQSQITSGLKYWRLERQLSQIELSLISDVPRHVIQLAEAFLQVPTVEYQMKLAYGLAVPVSLLFIDEQITDGDRK